MLGGVERIVERPAALWTRLNGHAQSREWLGMAARQVRTDSLNGAERIFTCAGFMAGSVVCMQIARLWRARGLACLRIVPCEHFPQEDPSGTAGRPGSSPPAPATHSVGADHPACRNPQAEHRCSGNWTLWLCRRARLLPAPGSTSAISRRPPAATSAPGCRRYSARWSRVGTRARTGRLDQAAARLSGGPPDPARPPRRRSPAQARSQEHSSASTASSDPLRRRLRQMS